MIKFGTDGWRAVISDEFTFANVNKVAKAIAFYLINHKLTKKPLIIGYDPRFLADKFAEAIAKVMEDAGINCYLTERDTPTPIVAWEVKDKKACGAVMITASHNPASYCGIKFIPDYAGPANEIITKELQEYANGNIELPRPKRKGNVERFEPRERYFKYLQSLIDFELIKRSGLKIIYDAMYGCGRGYLDRLLEENGIKAEVLHGERDVLFGGRNPEPDDENLEELKKRVVAAKADIGIANDGDADRFGIVDEAGNFLHANQVLALVCDYLIEDKGFTGSVVRSVATTHLLDRIAAKNKVKLHETPVGFKHIAALMMKEDVILGGEESGGLSIKGHIPEKDGLLANLLIIEMLGKRKKSLSQIWADLVKEYGEIFGEKLNLRFDKAKKEQLMNILKQNTPQQLAGLKIINVNKVDGVKLTLSEGSWILARPSGTEPLVRIYAESDKLEKLKVMIEAIKNLV
ncbi:MAG: phosphoglucomutase/phosphomannomutase family protein [Candidatus Margulisbacteria bacterium]|nr:phosphoglucomutase/phosphomannomutase family protein [Candidatus Margulisiibacteriota bacterium]